MQLKDWNIEALTGYKPKTTFYTDFGIAEKFGVDAIRDTYEAAIDEWGTNIEYTTELVMVLNWKIWEHYEKNTEYAMVYQELWEIADTYVFEHFDGDDLEYFIDTTD
ncbi:MAG: hypothetical protein IIW43_01740 [Selenomonadales bacterium]|nr:hypothetical protein [Selenomonadales bacterium]